MRFPFTHIFAIIFSLLFVTPLFATEPAIGNQKMEQGDTRFLDTSDPLFGLYICRFQTAVYEVWRYPKEAVLKGIAGQTQVLITFNRSGEITNIELLKSSGAPILDNESLRTLRAIGPVGSLPKGYGKKQFHLIVFFQYGKDRLAKPLILLR
jgi:protein TonB